MHRYSALFVTRKKSEQAGTRQRALQKCLAFCCSNLSDGTQGRSEQRQEFGNVRLFSAVPTCADFFQLTTRLKWIVRETLLGGPSV